MPEQMGDIMGVRKIKESEKASIIIVTYNHKRYIESCLRSLEKEKYPHEIIIIDSSSTDGTIEFVRNQFSHVKVFGCEKNLGYGSCNNLGVKYAEGKYIVILNPDTIVREGWLGELIKPLMERHNIITTPKILTYDGSLINTCGTINHFTGLTFTRGLGEDPNEYSEQEYVSGFSGCCFALRKNDYLRLGGFDETFFLYNEDSDLSWRSHLMNFAIMFIPTSIVMHDYVLKVSAEKLYYLEKDRYLILRKHISFYDFLFLFPSLAIVEILTIGYSMKLGLKGLKFKFKALQDGLEAKVDHKYGDKSNLYKKLSIVIPIDQLTFSPIDKVIKILANYIFSWNLRAVQ